jgi:hypothetical protein
MFVRSFRFRPHLFVLVVAALLSACGASNEPEQEIIEIEEEINPLPEFFRPALAADYGATAPTFTVIVNQSAGVAAPNDLEFHPHDDRRYELWVLNQGTPNRGGSTVIVSGAGTAEQSAEWRQDGNAWHFMSMPPAMAFGENGNWATSVGVQDANHDGGTFAGPSLWSSDMSIYAVVGERPTATVNGSHLDMLHGSPYSMGIAHDVDNAYWVFDGYHGHIVRYDFKEPHYPGGYDHSDALVHRYKEVVVERHPTLPSHMILDKGTGWLYINETVNQRILRMDTSAGVKRADLQLINEPLHEHWEMHQARWEVFVDEGLVEPVGMTLVDNRLFVTDHATGDVIAFDIDTREELARVQISPGIRGITAGPDGKLYVAHYSTNQVLRLEPQ